MAARRALSPSHQPASLNQAEQVGLVQLCAKVAAGPRHVGEAELGREHDTLDPGDREVHAAERERVPRMEVRGDVGLLDGECRRVEQHCKRIEAGAAVETVGVSAGSADQLRPGGEEPVVPGEIGRASCRERV